MKKEEVMAILSSIERQLAELKSMVLAENNENHQGETPDDTLVVNEAPNVPVVEKEIKALPAPPTEIHVDISIESVGKQAPDEETMLGCQIITDLPDFYNGKCSVLKLQKRYFDNGQPKLYIDKYHVVITALDVKGNSIGSIVTHWNNLAKFHAALMQRGINTHSKTNWMPKTIWLDLD